MEAGKTFPLDALWIKKLLAWADHSYPYMAYFDPNAIPYPHDGFEQIFFAGEKSYSLDQLQGIPDNQEKIGILGYELKNHFERLQSDNPGIIDCPESLFFLPSLKIKFSASYAEIFHASPSIIFDTICNFNLCDSRPTSVEITASTNQEEYIQKVQKIKEHITEGDIYEMNYCIAFHGSFSALNPVQVYFDLTEKSPMPFSSIFKAGTHYLVGASPERFLKKSGSTIIAQPIKGTSRRGDSHEEDLQLKLKLKNSEKEQAENLMIVDLMRNDLARISAPGKVKVEELFGIYGFKRIFQMISTVSSTLRESLSFEEIIAKTFPMGSMTGAPKIRCMELIEQYEDFKRGWFSGAVGYISSDGNFDFNVVIRSIVIDKASGKLFFAVGSAITFDADPIREYEECLLKAQPLFEVLTGARKLKSIKKLS